MKKIHETLAGILQLKTARNKIVFISAAVVLMFLGLIGTRLVDARTAITPLSSTTAVFDSSDEILAVTEVSPEFTIHEPLSVESLPQFSNCDRGKLQTPQEGEWVKVRMRVTAYCPCAKCCGRNADGKTANMHKINWGDRFVAADKMYSFGTEMIVPGYNHGKPIKVMDRGRVIKGNRLDVFYNTHHTASKWGTRYIDVLVKRK